MGANEEQKYGNSIGYLPKNILRYQLFFLPQRIKERKDIYATLRTLRLCG